MSQIVAFVELFSLYDEKFSVLYSPHRSQLNMPTARIVFCSGGFLKYLTGTENGENIGTAITTFNLVPFFIKSNGKI